METTEIIRILRQCGDCCLTNCTECPEYKKAEEGFRKDPEAKGFMWSCGGVLLDAADRLEELDKLVNEWEPVVHGRVDESVVHGHWIGEADGYADGELVYDVWYCSECNFCIDEGIDDPGLLPSYCENCGAKMDEGVAG